MQYTHTLKIVTIDQEPQKWILWSGISNSKSSYGTVSSFKDENKSQTCIHIYCARNRRYVIELPEVDCVQVVPVVA